MRNASLCTSLVVLAVFAAVGSAVQRPGASFTGELFKQALTVDGPATVTLTPKDSHRTLVTGQDEFSMYLEHRPRITPELQLNVTRGIVVSAELFYGPKAFAVPPGTLVLRDHAHSILFQVTLKEFQGSETKHVTLDWPEAFKKADNLPDIVYVELMLLHQEVSTFVYTFENGIPTDLYDSGETYDLTPHNSTMLTKFMMKVTKTPSAKLSVWLSRKPTAPDFSLLVFLDGELFSDANIERDPHSSDALGFDLEIQEDVARFLSERVDLVAHYYERHRAVNAVVKIDNLRKLINDLKASDKPLVSKVLPSDVHHMSVKITYHRGTDFAGVKLLMGSPMADVQLSVYRIDPETGARTLFLREGDDVIPYYRDLDSEIQYGWDDALPVSVDAVKGDEGEDLLDAPAEIEVSYNQGAIGNFGVGRVLERWIESNGGYLHHLDLDFLDTKDHSFKLKHPLVSRAPVEVDAIIAKIPYSTMVTSQIVERSTWSEVLQNHSDEHSAHVRDNEVHSDAPKIMKLTAAVYLNLFDESMNYRPYFHTYVTSAQKLAPYFTEEELTLFDFDPQIRVEMKRMKDLWEQEFQVLQKAVQNHKLPRTVDKDAYFRVRSQVETRLVNLTDHLVLAPVIDLLTHDDAPNCHVEYSDEDHFAIVRATRNISAGTPLTLDFGGDEKTGLDFLVQFGFVPPKAIKAATVQTPIGPMFLTEDASSFKAIETAFNEKADGEGYGDAKAEILKRLTQVSSIPVPPRHDVSERVTSAANLLRDHEKDVLTKWSKQ